ncbi:MAG: hypothetical protein M3Y71_02585, partial [Actinomycetota bacterium]|nr:hypothetical protein [Actinomycetota bacterium]
PPVRAARLARRRRLLVRSAPVVVVLLLVALKLLTMVAAGHQARVAYDGGSITSLEQSGQRMAFLNVVERHKAPFALGDAAVLAGDFDTARARFEQALRVAPSDGLEACQVRVNLVLALEQLGDKARSASGADAAKPFDDRIAAVAAGAPAGCFQPQGQGTGQRLDEARSRALQKGSAEQPSPGQDPPLGQDPPQPGTDKQQQLDQKTKDNQAQRAQGDQGARDSNGGSRPQVDKPW